MIMLIYQFCFEGVAAVLIPLMTIGNFRNIFHSNEKKEAIDALKHAKKELEKLRTEISLILNQTTPILSKPESLSHKRVVREVKETVTKSTTTSSPNSTESTTATIKKEVTPIPVTTTTSQTPSTTETTTIVVSQENKNKSKP